MNGIDPKLLSQSRLVNPDTLRPDGRIEVYDIVSNERGYACVFCQQNGNRTLYTKQNEVFMLNGANTLSGKHAFICKGHLPDDVVIYDPVSDTCRNKAGDQTWKE